MAITDHAPVTIIIDSVGVARRAFGVALLVSHNAPFAERVRTYSSLAGVAADFSDTTSPEYLAAQAFFGQNPHPTSLKIGRAALKPTVVYEIDVVTVRNSHVYSLLVKGEGVTPTTVSFTSDGTATEAEINTGLQTALQAVVGRNFAAVDNTTSITVTGSAAGEWFSIEVPNRADLSVEVTHADPGIATDLAAIQVEDDGWYELLTCYNSSAYVLAAAAWVESAGKRYRADCYDTAALTATVGSATDLIDDLRTLGYERTMGCFHPDPSSMFAARWAGRVLAIAPGKIVEFGKTLAGLAPVSMTSTERTNLTNKRGNSYEFAGVNVTFDGKSAMNKRFFDTVRDRDALADAIRASVMEALVAGNKVEYSDEGAAIINSALRAALRRNTTSAGELQILTGEFTTSVPAVADVSSADKTDRILPDVKFSGTIGGGVQKVPVNGVISL